MLELQRALGNPPEGEIWSGKALNDILDNVKRMQAPGVPTPFVPVDQETLGRINVQGSGGEGNFGLLKDGGNLQFPFALQAPAFDQYRSDISKLFQSAANAANLGPVPFATIDKLDTTLGALDENLWQIRSSEISALGRSGPKYIKELRQSTRARRANVTQYARKVGARGGSVRTITQMSRTGCGSPHRRERPASYLRCTRRWWTTTWRHLSSSAADGSGSVGGSPRQ
jgi:hypothetical protein